ncbi:MAG: hypothetical protein V4668_04675 [Patescibacteria group bacterium]
MSKKSHTYLALACLCFLVVAGIFVSMWYMVNRQGVHFDEAKRAIAEYAAKEASYTKVQGLLASTEDDRAAIDSYFIEEKNIISFISDMEKNAAVLGVKLNTNELATMPAGVDTAGVAFKAVLVIGFDFTGTKSSVQEFISLLENIPYQNTITELSFTNVDATIWKADSTLKLTLQYD